MKGAEKQSFGIITLSCSDVIFARHLFAVGGVGIGDPEYCVSSTETKPPTVIPRTSILPSSLQTV